MASSSPGTLTVLGTPEIIPEAYSVDGNQTGFLVDIVKEAFRRAGRPVEIRLMPWARCLSETRYGSMDGFFGAYKTSDRESYVSFSHESLISQTQALFVRKGSPITFDGDLSALAGFRFGLIYGTSYGPRFDGFLAERGSTRDEKHGSLENAIKMLAGGRIDLFPGDRQAVAQIAKALGLGDQIIELSPTIEMVPTYLAYTRKRDMATLIKDIDRSLATMKQDGFYDAKFRQYYPL